jgi:Transposase protein/Winged helix-turn helix
MPGTRELPLLPEGALTLGPRLAVLKTAEEIIFMNASGPLMSCAREDATAKRYLGAVLMKQGLARAADLAEVLDVDRATLFRNQKLYREGGLEALRDGRGRGAARRAHKLTDEVLVLAQQCLAQGASQSATARAVGVSEATIRHAIKTARLHRPRRAHQHPAQIAPRERAERDALEGQGAGTAVKRLLERNLACTGRLDEAPPQFEPVEGVANAGVLLALPAIVGEGLLRHAEHLYGSLKAGFYGLRSILLCLVMMALLRIKNIEQLSAQQPGELGLLLGLDRVPEVKTVRRKLHELAERHQAAALAAALTAQWSQGEPDELGVLYVDGHVSTYTGRKHALPKTFVQKRRQCQAASTDAWVHNAAAQPLFFVTSPINAHLLTLLDGEIIAQARQQIGPQRRLTLVFDREAWSPKTFQRWHGQKIDVITYRKGKQLPWDSADFQPWCIQREGLSQTYWLAQRSVLVTPAGKSGPAFWMREVRRLCANGHQTAILTTRQDLPIEQIAELMFARWRQENFFKYMQSEFDLDHLSTYATEPGDAQRSVVNPERTALEKKLKASRAQLGRAYTKQAKQQREGKSTTTLEKCAQTIEQLEQQCAQLSVHIEALDERVPLSRTRDPSTIVHHERERKTISHLLKIVAYRSETCLASLVGPHFARHDEEVRAFLKAAFKLPGDIVPDYQRRELRVRLYGLANNRSQQALAALCECLNAQQVNYPGTDLRLVYDAIQSH